mmetsp:Transcript_3435/g.7700  ORF Transcript_3435/g.7700 Transcript_3435/m.7700 type:complete len:236 (-) Transcript_3435:16-723(-)
MLTSLNLISSTSMGASSSTLSGTSEIVLHSSSNLANVSSSALASTCVSGWWSSFTVDVSPIDTSPLSNSASCSTPTGASSTLSGIFLELDLYSVTEFRLLLIVETLLPIPSTIKDNLSSDGDPSPFSSDLPSAAASTVPSALTGAWAEFHWRSLSCWQSSFDIDDLPKETSPPFNSTSCSTSAGVSPLDLPGSSFRLDFVYPLVNFRLSLESDALPDFSSGCSSTATIVPVLSLE